MTDTTPTPSDPTDGERYRTRSVSVEAVQWDGTKAGAELILAWINNPRAGYVAMDGVLAMSRSSGARIDIPGSGCVLPGDWVIKTPKGEFERCHMDLFWSTYEREATDG